MMKILKKYFVIFILLAFLVSLFSNATFGYDLSSFFDKKLNEINSICKDCNISTPEQISRLSFDEWKVEAENLGLDSDETIVELYAISNLKSGKEQVSISDGSDHFEFFRLTSIDKIPDFFKTKINYDAEKYENDLKKAKIKNAFYFGLGGGLFTYAYTYLLDKIIQKSGNKSEKKAEKNKSTEKRNKNYSISNKVKFILSSIIGAISAGYGFYLGGYAFEKEVLAKYRDAKDDVAFYLKDMFDKGNEDNDYIGFSINLDCPEKSMASFYKAGIEYNQDEQKAILENTENFKKQILEIRRGKYYE